MGVNIIGFKHAIFVSGRKQTIYDLCIKKNK